MSDIFLYAGQPSPADIALRDPAFVAVQYNLSAGAGPFALTGINTGGKGFAGTVTAAAGAFVLTAVSAALKAGHNVAGNAAALVLTGKQAAQNAGRAVAPSSAALTLSGVAAALNDGRDSVESAGSFALNGAGVSVLSGRIMRAATATTAIVGAPINTITGRVVSGAAGAFGLTGFDATLVGYSAQRSLFAGAGSFDLSGQTAALSVARPSSGAGRSRRLRSAQPMPRVQEESVLTARAGAFGIGAAGAQLTASRALCADGAAMTCGASETAMFDDVWEISPEEALIVLLEAA